MAIDFREMEGRRGRDDAERVWCVATLTESASIKVEITVYGEAGRGVWVKADGAVTKKDVKALRRPKFPRFGMDTPAGTAQARLTGSRPLMCFRRLSFSSATSRGSRVAITRSIPSWTPFGSLR